jgi:sugar/nucleoside kinase (ribokinase family)
MHGATKDFVVTPDLYPQVTDCTVFHAGGIGLTEAMDKGGHSAEVMKAAQAAGAKTTVDIFAGSPKDLPAVAAVLPYTDYFMPSIEEAQALCSLTDYADTAKFFFDMGVKTCVLTLGGEGAYYHSADGTKFTIPAFDVHVKCTCGCGDAFNAGFATGLVKGFSPEDTVRFAIATSGLNATGLGSQAGVVDFEHTLNFMKTAKTK